MEWAGLRQCCPRRPASRTGLQATMPGWGQLGMLRMLVLSPCSQRQLQTLRPRRLIQHRRRRRRQRRRLWARCNRPSSSPWSSASNLGNGIECASIGRAVMPVATAAPPSRSPSSPRRSMRVMCLCSRGFPSAPPLHHRTGEMRHQRKLGEAECWKRRCPAKGAGHRSVPIYARLSARRRRGGPSGCASRPSGAGGGA